jgi:Flp pilus assembly pilin Flp
MTFGNTAPALRGGASRSAIALCPRLARRLAGDQSGLTTVEYTIVLCLIAALCVGTWAAFGGDLERYISSASVTLRDHLHTGGKGDPP